MGFGCWLGLNHDRGLTIQMSKISKREIKWMKESILLIKYIILCHWKHKSLPLKAEKLCLGQSCYSATEIVQENKNMFVKM